MDSRSDSEYAHLVHTFWQGRRILSARHFPFPQKVSVAIVTSNELGSIPLELSNGTYITKTRETKTTVPPSLHMWNDESNEVVHGTRATAHT